MAKAAATKRKTRRYHSPRRKEQAEATRKQILDAAERLFIRDGYVATSMAAIAKEAGVALKTVYLAFETKSGLLRALWHRNLRGGREDVPVGDQAWFREVIEEPDPAKALRLNARNSSAGQDADRSARERDPERGRRRPRDQGALGADLVAVLRQPARRGEVDPPAQGPQAGAQRGPCRRHPLDAQPSEGVPAAPRRRGAGRPRTYERWLADITCAELLRRRAPETRR